MTILTRKIRVTNHICVLTASTEKKTGAACREEVVIPAASSGAARGPGTPQARLVTRQAHCARLHTETEAEKSRKRHPGYSASQWRSVAATGRDPQPTLLFSTLTQDAETHGVR